MKKSKIIAISLGTIGLVAGSTAVATTLTSCSDDSSGYSPFADSKVIDVIPDLKTYNEMQSSYQSFVEDSISEWYQATHTAVGMIFVYGNTITLQTTWYKIPFTKVGYEKYVYRFNDSNVVKVEKTTKDGNNQAITTRSTTVFSVAKNQIYKMTNYKK